MRRIHNVLRVVCVVALSFMSSDAANGLEIYVVGLKTGANTVLGRLTITGSDVAYTEVKEQLGNSYVNLAVRDASSFYSVNEGTGSLAIIDLDGNVSNVGGSSLYTGLTSIGSTLYGAKTPDNTFGTIDTSNGDFSSIGSIGTTLVGGTGRMAALGSTIYMTNGSTSTSTFGTVNVGSGTYSDFFESSAYASLLLVASGSTLYGIDPTSLQVSTINVGTGALTPFNATSGTLPLQVYGAAVPEPGTYVLAGIAGCVLAIASRRKLKCEQAKSAKV